MSGDFPCCAPGARGASDSAAGSAPSTDADEWSCNTSQLRNSPNPPFLTPHTWTPDAEGEAVTFARSDLPAVANRREFDITVSAEDIEQVYLELRKRQLGADSRGDL